MKKTLNKAPLVHAVIDLRFSLITELEEIETDLMKHLHPKMIEVGLIELIKSSAEEVEFMFAKDNVKRNVTTRTRTLFRDKYQTSIVELTETSMKLKTTAYHTFEEFHDKFKKTLQAVNEVVANFPNILMKKVNLRYIDVIVPTNSYTLKDFVGSNLMPPVFENNDKSIYGKTIKIMKVAKNQELAVFFEELLINQNQVTKVLPDDLIEFDRDCALKIKGHNYWSNVSSMSYGILDINNTFLFEDGTTIDLSLVNKAIATLYKESKKVFWNAITATAKNEWQVSKGNK